MLTVCSVVYLIVYIYRRLRSAINGGLWTKNKNKASSWRSLSFRRQCLLYFPGFVSVNLPWFLKNSLECFLTIFSLYPTMDLASTSESFTFIFCRNWKLCINSTPRVLCCTDGRLTMNSSNTSCAWSLLNFTFSSELELSLSRSFSLSLSLALV